MRFVLVSEPIVNAYLDAAQAGRVIDGRGRNAFVAAIASLLDAIAQPSVVFAPAGTTGERSFPWVRFPGRDDWHEDARPVPLVGIVPPPSAWGDAPSSMEIQAVQLLNEEDGPRPSVQAPSAFEATRKVYWFALRNALLLLASSGRRSSGTPGTAPSGDLFTPSTVMAVDGEATSALVNETAALVENAEVIANARSVFNAARIFASALEAFEHGGQIAAAALHVDAATLNQSIAAQTASRKYQMLAVGSIVAAPLVGWLASKLFKRRAPIALGKGRR